MALTSREQQVLKLIKQNPLITQKELAKILGITRPGVASHISRLIKQGYISGKGYVLPKKEFVTVIGAVNMDIYGDLSETEIIPKGSNAGHIIIQLGGMARNIAANLRELDVNTNLITVYGIDQNGESFKEDAVKKDINISYSQQFLNKRTSMYLYINKKDGDRVIGVDDMDINNEITPDFLASRLPQINASKYVVLDSNIPSETIKWLYDNVEVPIIAKAVSVAKTPRLIQNNIRLDSLIINGVEASMITKLNIKNIEDAKQCAKQLSKLFKSEIYLYVDDLGLFIRTENHQRTKLYSDDIEIINTNGVGASLAAGVTYAKLKKLHFNERIHLLEKIIKLSMASRESVSADISSLVND